MAGTVVDLAGIVVVDIAAGTVVGTAVDMTVVVLGSPPSVVAVVYNLVVVVVALLLLRVLVT